MTTARAAHTATLLPNGKVLIVGSETGTDAPELYDSNTNTWTPTAKLNANRWWPPATLLQDGRVLVSGGQDRASAEIYDPVTGTWSVTGSLALARYGHTATLLPNGKVLIAGGRIGNVEALNLPAAGLAATDRGFLEVNEHFQTRVPHVYAAGDLVGFPGLASTSKDQGVVAMTHACGRVSKRRVNEMLPVGIYTIPEVSSAGETEESLQKRNVPYVVGRAPLEENARANLVGEAVGFLKLVAGSDGQLLGVHCIGPHASELVHLGNAVMAYGAAVVVAASVWRDSRDSRDTGPRRMVLTGTVKHFDGDKGFGFIVPDDGSEDVFFHRSRLGAKTQFEDLREGDEVQFQVRPGEKGPQAFDLRTR